MGIDAIAEFRTATRMQTKASIKAISPTSAKKRATNRVTGGLRR